MSLSYSAGGAMPLPKYAWSFDGTTTDYVNQLAPSSSGAAQTYGAGKYNQAALFTNPVATSDTPTYYQIYSTSGAFQSAVGFTISFWFNQSNKTSLTSYQSIIGFNSTANSYYNDINVTPGVNGTIGFYGQNPSGSGFGLSIPSPVNAVLGTWYHVAFVMFNKVTTMYLNGNQYGTGTYINEFTIRDVTVSSTSQYYTGHAFCGSVDDLRVYNTALTSTQVQSIYNQQGVPGRGVLIPQSPRPSLAWTFNGTLTDSVQGISFSGTPVYSTGKYAQGLSVINSASYNTGTLPAASNIVTTNGLTVCAWAQITAGGGASLQGPNKIYIFILNSAVNNTIGNSNPLVMALGFFNGWRISYFYNDPGNGYREYDAPTVAVLNTWYHFCVVFGGSSNKTMTFYINGVAQGSPIAYTTDMSGTTAYNNIYNFGVTNNTFTVSDSRIYNSALTAAQVQAIYGTSGMPSQQVMTGTPLFTQLSPSATSSAVGAFSLRAVNGTSTRAVQVRNGTTSAVQDFYADRLGNLLTAPVTGQTLQNWLGGATGYVTTWYDQSGKGNHMSCSSTGIQPKIDTTNGWIDFKTSAYFDTSANPSAGPVPWDSTKNYTVVCHHNTIGYLFGSMCETYSTDLQSSNYFTRNNAGYDSYWLNPDSEQYGGTYSVGNRVTFKWDGTNRYIYTNGSIQNTQFEPNLWYQNSSGTQKIGYNTFDNRPINGEMYSIFMFNTSLSDADRALVEAAS